MPNNLTVNQSFQKFLENLNPTDAQYERIKNTRTTIDTVLLNDNRIKLVTPGQASFLTGSYARKTIIKPIDDIDLYVKVHYGVHAKDKTPRSILLLIASSLRKRYPQTKVNVDSPCVVVKFLDYKFEIVPCFFYSDNKDLFSIPAPGSREWMQCYPNIPSQWLSSCNSINNGMFIRLIKMIKQLSRHNFFKMKSFHIELLTEKVFNSISRIDSYPQGLFDWLYCVREWIWENQSPFVTEPGNNNIYIDDYLYKNKFKLGVARRKIDASLKKAERAWTLYNKGRNGIALNIWRNMFGPKFPSPAQPPANSNYAPQQAIAPALKDIFQNQPARGLLGEPQRNSFSENLSKLFQRQPAIDQRNKDLPALIALLGKPKDPFKG